MLLRCILDFTLTISIFPYGNISTPGAKVPNANGSLLSGMQWPHGDLARPREVREPKQPMMQEGHAKKLTMKSLCRYADSPSLRVPDRSTYQGPRLRILRIPQSSRFRLMGGVATRSISPASSAISRRTRSPSRVRDCPYVEPRLPDNMGPLRVARYCSISLVWSVSEGSFSRVSQWMFGDLF